MSLPLGGNLHWHIPKSNLKKKLNIYKQNSRAQQQQQKQKNKAANALMSFWRLSGQLSYYLIENEVM